MKKFFLDDRYCTIYGIFFAALLLGNPNLFAVEEIFDTATGQTLREDSEAFLQRQEKESLGNLYRNAEAEFSEEETDSENLGESVLKTIEWGVVAEGELASNLNSNACYQSASDAVFTADLGFLMKLSPRASFYGLIEAGYGEGLDGRIPTFGGFNDEVNGENHLHFSQAWYEQKFGNNDQWRLKIGQIDICCEMDMNNYANCGYYQFNSTGFVVNLTFEHAAYTFGTVLWRDFGDHFSIGAAYLSDDRWTNVFSAGCGVLEADIRVDLNGHPGIYRFYGWVNESDLLYEDGETNSGWGISADQEVSRHLGVWGRIGFADGSVGILESHLTGGVQFQHFSAKYERDFIGLAYGVAAPGEKYAQTAEFAPGNEHFFEAYYLRRLSEFAHLTPFIQYVKNPAGEVKAGSVFVLGVRGVVEI